MKTPQNPGPNDFAPEGPASYRTGGTAMAHGSAPPRRHHLVTRLEVTVNSVTPGWFTDDVFFVGQ